MRLFFSYRPISMVLVLCAGLNGWAQVNSLSDLYQGNLLLLNPALAGTGQYGNLSILSRQQWVGWNGAPAEQSVTYHTKWAKAKERFNPLGFINKGKNTYSKVGVGAGFFHESYGIFHITGIHLNYAYHIYSLKGRLSFGLSPSVFQVATTSLLLTDPKDPYLDNPVRAWLIDFNAGIHYFTKLYYAGFSVVQLFNSSVKFGRYGFPATEDPSLNPDLARSLYAYGGYFFTLNRDINLKIEPMGVVKYNARTGIRFDAGSTVHLRDQFSLGIQYVYRKGINVLAGIRLDNLSFRYLFEIPVSPDLPGRYASHLIQVALNVGQPID